MNIFEKNNNRFVSHRGFTPLAPENSLPSFAYAGLLGQWAIETDVHITRDGEIVCCHNGDVERYCGTSAKIAETTYSELLKLPIINGNRVGCFSAEERRIPKFSKYLEICRRYGSVPFIELKTDDAERVAWAVRAAGYADDEVVISSSDLEHLKSTRLCSKDLFVHWIFADETRLGEISALENSGVSFKIADPFECPAEKIKDAQAKGLKVCLRAADDLKNLKHMYELGLDYFPTNCMHGEIK